MAGALPGADMTHDEIMRAARIGGLVVRLETLKRAGRADWMMACSWCSDLPVFFAIARPAGARLGQPSTGLDLEDVLRRAIAVADPPPA